MEKGPVRNILIKCIIHFFLSNITSLPFLKMLLTQSSFSYEEREDTTKITFNYQVTPFFTSFAKCSLKKHHQPQSLLFIGISYYWSVVLELRLFTFTSSSNGCFHVTQGAAIDNIFFIADGPNWEVRIRREFRFH